MYCPVCDQVRMREVEKEDVLIDICPNCKGVWLDRGELEKITKGLREEQDYYSKPYESDNRYEKDKRVYTDYAKDFLKGHKSKYDKHGYPSKRKRKKSMVDILSDFL